MYAYFNQSMSQEKGHSYCCGSATRIVIAMAFQQNSFVHLLVISKYSQNNIGYAYDLPVSRDLTTAWLSELLSTIQPDAFFCVLLASSGATMLILAVA